MALKQDKAELLSRVAAALSLSGWQMLWLNDDHPAHVQLIKGDVRIEAWIHIWNLTPGGRPDKMPNERRIQPTGIQGRFTARPGARTIILGWSDEVQVFAAFDYGYHSLPFGKSSSVQTDLHALESAAQDGIGVFTKGTGELSIAVRSDMLGLYVEQIETLHGSGRDPAQLESLMQMASNPLAIQPGDLPRQRRVVMTTTLRLLRARRFSENVLAAYSHRCAFCGVQLRLLDAAHILPVAHPDSDDNVTNGVALCALHHRAYDTALATFDEHFEIRVNQDALARLGAEGRDGGFNGFQAALGPSLLLPKAQASHPSPQMIVKANALRGWA